MHFTLLTIATAAIAVSAAVIPEADNVEKRQTQGVDTCNNGKKWSGFMSSTVMPGCVALNGAPKPFNATDVCAADQKIYCAKNAIQLVAYGEAFYCGKTRRHHSLVDTNAFEKQMPIISYASMTM
jgi:hypothetical protein